MEGDRGSLERKLPEGGDGPAGSGGTPGRRRQNDAPGRGRGRADAGRCGMRANGGLATASGGRRVRGGPASFAPTGVITCKRIFLEEEAEGRQRVKP